ncbi:MAG: hypothetical protein R3F34_08075 [Planctomycetota bacterium]
MNTTIVGGTLVGALALSLAFAQEGGGEHASHTFAKEPVNARALASLEDFKGRPVLVEFWGTH